MLCQVSDREVLPRSSPRAYLSAVIAGLDPAIHEAVQRIQIDSKAFSSGNSSWMRGSSPRMTLNVGRCSIP